MVHFDNDMCGSGRDASRGEYDDVWACGNTNTKMLRHDVGFGKYVELKMKSQLAKFVTHTKQVFFFPSFPG